MHASVTTYSYLVHTIYRLLIPVCQSFYSENTKQKVIQLTSINQSPLLIVSQPLHPANTPEQKLRLVAGEA